MKRPTGKRDKSIVTKIFYGCQHFENLLKKEKEEGEEIKPLQTEIRVGGLQTYLVDYDGRLVSTEEGANQMSFSPSSILGHNGSWAIVS